MGKNVIPRFFTIFFAIILIIGVSNIFIEWITNSMPGSIWDLKYYQKDVTITENNKYDVRDKFNINFAEKNVKIVYELPISENGITFDIESILIRTDLEYDISKNKNYLRITFNSKEHFGNQEIEVDYVINKGMIYEDNDYAKISLYNLQRFSPEANYKLFLTLPKQTNSNLKFYLDENSLKLNDELRNNEFNIDNNNGVYEASLNDKYNFGPNYIGYIDLGKDYFKDEKDYEAMNGIKIVVYIVITIVFFLVWFFKGKDDKIIHYPFFSSPDDLNPMEIGYWINRDLEYNEIFHMLLYWANNGYVKIIKKSNEEYVDIATGARIGDYVFKKIKDLDINAPEYEKIIFKAFFELEDDDVTPNEFHIKDFLKETTNLFGTLQTYAQEMARAEEAFYKEQKVFEDEGNDPSAESTFNFMKYMICLLWGCTLFIYTDFTVATFSNFAPLIFGIITAFMGLFMQRDSFKQYSLFAIPIFFIFTIRIINPVVLLLLLICTMLTVLIRKRNFKYNELVGKIYGFRDVIAESKYKNDVKKLASENSNYFYYVLPYALTLDKENDWFEKFDSISSPSWFESYTGENLTRDNIKVLTDDMDEICKAILVNVNNSATSGKKKIAVEDM